MSPCRGEEIQGGFTARQPGAWEHGVEIFCVSGEGINCCPRGCREAYCIGIEGHGIRSWEAARTNTC